MRWAILKVTVRLDMLTTTSIYLLPKHLILKSQEMPNTGSPSLSEPFFSFIIPSSLKRHSLHFTIASLHSQTETNWEAIVGVDVRQSDIAAQSEHFLYNLYDERVRYLPIYSNSSNRGVDGNGAGDIRNRIIKKYAWADWVAFVDDDDTLSPYVELLREGIRQDESADIFIFRMEFKDGWIIPPRGMVLSRSKTTLGLVSLQGKTLCSEDWCINLLSSSHSAQSKRAVIKISPEVTYFVRRQPSRARPESLCFERAIVRVNLTRPVLSTCYTVPSEV